MEIANGQSNIFKTIYNETPALLHSINQKGIIVEVSNFWLLTLGYDRKEVIGKPISSFIDKRHRRITREAIKSLFDQKKTIQVERKFIKKDGTTIDVAITEKVIMLDGEERSLSSMTDITDQKKTKNDLKEAEDDYRFLFDSNHDIICLYNYDGSVLKVSPAVQSILGYTTDEFKSKPAYDIFCPEDRDHVKKAVTEALSGKINRFDARVFHSSGAILWLECIIQAKFDETGKVKYVMTSSRNVNRRKENEEKLKRNEAFLNKAEIIAKICYWIYDYETEQIEWSQGFFQLFNLEALRNKKFSIQDLLQYVHHEDLEIITTKYKDRIAQNGKERADFRFRIILDGKVYFLRGSFEGYISKDKIFGILQDITEISEKERSLNKAQEIAKIGSFDWDAVQNKLTWSDQLYKIFGRTQDNFNGTFEDFIACLHPESKDDFMKQLHNAMKKGGPFLNDEKIMRPDGTIRILSTIGEVTLDENGKPIRIQGTCNDVTEKKEKDQQLIQSEKQLKKAQKAAKIGYWKFYTLNSVFEFSDELGLILGIGEKSTLPDSDLLDLIHPKDKERVQEEWLSVIKGNSYKNEFRVIVEGVEKWIYVEASPQIITQGRTHTIDGIVQDITFRKLIELKLKEGESRYRLLFENAFDGIMIFDDKNKQYIDCNQKILDLFKLSRPDFLKLSHEDLSARKQNGKSTSDIIKKYSRQFKNKDSIHFEWKAKKSDGSLFDVEITVLDFEKGKHTLIFLIKDITQRKIQEEVLKTSEERYRSLYNNTPVMLHSIDRNGRIIEVSEYWLHKMKYKKYEVIGKQIYDFLHPDDRDYAQNIAIPSFFKYGRADDVRYKFVSKEGSIFDVSLSAIEIQSPTGSYSLTVSQDITAVKNAERALINSEKKYRQLVSSSPTILYQYSYKEKKNIFYSDKIEDIIGYDAQYLSDSSKTWLNSIHKDDLPRVKEGLNNARNGSKIEIEFRIRNKSGHWKWVKNLSIGLEKNNDDIILSGIIIDISKERNAMDALRESEMKLHTIINTIPNPIFYKDLDGYYLGVNDNFAKFIGKTKEKIIASSITDVYTGSNVDKLSQLDKELIKSKNHSIISNQKLFSENSIRDVIVYKSKWKDTEGNLLGIAGTFVDVTDIKETTRRLKNIITSLPGIVFRSCYNFKEYKMEFMSDQTTEIIGYSPNDFVPHGDLPFLQIVQESDREAILKRLKEIPKSYIETKFRVLTKDGSEKWLWERCLILIEDDQIIKEGILMDITDTVNMEDRIISATLQTEDNERRRISQTIHDGVQQVLISALLSLQAIENDILKYDDRVRKYYNQSYRLLKNGLDETREIAHKLMPKAIEDFGIVKSLETMLQMLNSTTDTAFSFYHNLQDRRFDKEIEMNIYRICQEATSNIVKYAGASEAHIQIIYHPKLLSVTIEDDGKGFEIGETHLLYKGFGVSSMRSRAAAISGTLEIESRPNHGTMVLVEVPVDKS